MKYFYNKTIRSLNNDNKIYRLIESFKDEGKEVIDNLENYFPIFEWGKINWDCIKNSVCTTVKDDNKIVESILKISEKYKLHGDVYIMWSNAGNPIINVNLDIALYYLKIIILEDMDTWIINTSFKWCIEVYHEGEVCFGFSRKNSIASRREIWPCKN